MIPLFISGIATNLWRNKIKSIIDNATNSRNIVIRDLFIVGSVILQVILVTLANLLVQFNLITNDSLIYQCSYLFFTIWAVLHLGLIWICFKSTEKDRV